MGAREKNFYNELAQHYGYEKEAKEIQDLYLDGKKAEAAAAVQRNQAAMEGAKANLARAQAHLHRILAGGERHLRRRGTPGRTPRPPRAVGP